MNSGALLPCHALLSTNDTCAWQGEVDAEIQVLRGHSLPWKNIVPQSCHKLQWITMGLVGPGYYDTFALSRRWKHGLLSMHACERRLTFASSTLHVHLDPSMIRSFWQIHLNPAGVKIHIFHYIYIYRYKNNDKNPEKHESDYWTYNNNLQNITKYHTMTIKWHNKNRIYKWAKWSTNIYKSTLYE